MDYIGRYSFADFFAKTASLVGKTWRQVFIVAGVTALAYAALGTLVLDAYFGLVAGVTELSTAGINGGYNARNLQAAQKALGAVGSMFGLLLLFGAIAMATRAAIEAAIPTISWRAVKGEDFSLRACLPPSLSSLAPRLLGQGVAVYAIFTIALSIVSFIVMIPLSIGLAFTSGANPVGMAGSAVGLSLFMAFLYAAATGVFLGTAQFTGPMAVIEGRKAFSAYGASVKLSFRHFWRMLLIGLVGYLAMSFAVSLVSVPLMFGFQISFLSNLDVRSLSEDPAAILQSFRSIMLVFGIAMFLAKFAHAAFYVPFKTLLAIDLKFRRGDFVAAEVADGEASGNGEGAGAGISPGTVE